jgi:hypothetical protein
MKRPPQPHLQLVTRDGVVEPSSCHAQALDFGLLSDVDVTDAELLLLRVTRLLCAGFSSGSILEMENAHAVAEATLGCEDAALLVARITSFLRALARERRGTFGYMNAKCPTCAERATPEERAVIQLLRDLKGADAPSAGALCMAFANHTSVPAITTSAIALSAWVSSMNRLGVRHLASVPPVHHGIGESTIER